jgi:hypothetical protein
LKGKIAKLLQPNKVGWQLDQAIRILFFWGTFSFLSFGYFSFFSFLSKKKLYLQYAYIYDRQNPKL